MTTYRWRFFASFKVLERTVSGHNGTLLGMLRLLITVGQECYFECDEFERVEL